MGCAPPGATDASVFQPGMTRCPPTPPEGTYETGDAGYIKRALSTLARTRGMSELATAAGVTRQGLYKALSEDGDPRLSTLLGVINSQGVRLSIQKGS